MSEYIKEVFDNELYKVKHIAGKEASETAIPSFHASGRLGFWYFVKGGGNIVIDSTRYEISDGDIFVMKSTEFFKHNIDDKCFHERISLIIYPQILKNLPNNYSQVLPPFFKRKNGVGNRIPCDVVREYHLDKLYAELLDYSKEKSGIGIVLALSRVLEIVATINKIITKIPIVDSANTIKDSRAIDILRYIHTNLTKVNSIEDVANHFNLDRSYLSRLFKERTGLSMWDYVIMRRIHMFNYLIKDSNSIEDTAYRVGFKNYSNFYRLYKKYMGMTPIEFKKSLYMVE